MQVHYSKTLTEHDIEHIERHLSMKRTIRKKIMRDLQQAFVQVILLDDVETTFFLGCVFFLAKGINILMFFLQDPTELSKNSVGRNKREINLQVK